MPWDYKKKLETHEDGQKMSSYLLEDEPAHLAVPLASRPDDENVAAIRALRR
jgi:hypothetical protein